MGNIPPCGFCNRQQSAAQNRLFLCSVRPGLLSEMENNSLNVGRASMVTGTSSGISPVYGLSTISAVKVNPSLVATPDLFAAISIDSLGLIRTFIPDGISTLPPGLISTHIPLVSILLNFRLPLLNILRLIPVKSLSCFSPTFSISSMYNFGM